MNHNIENYHTIGIDIAKNSFAVHVADDKGKPVYKTTCSRTKLMEEMSSFPVCEVFMEACGGAHHLGREFEKMGHQVGLIPPVYVKPFVKRQKNDANDAAAIVEAASRPTMRKIRVKSEEQQSMAAIFRARSLLVAQRTQTANSIRGLLAEFGITVPKGLAQVNKLRELVAAQEDAIPDVLLDALDPLFDNLTRLSEKIAEITTKMHENVKRNDDTQRLMQIPGIGPITAFALLAFAGDMNAFRNGREFAAWLGMTPKEHSTGGRHNTGAITKMGQRDIRQLLVNGAMTVIKSRKRAERCPHSWLAMKLAQKPTKVVGVALANKMARVIWHMTVHQEDYDPNRSCIG